MVDGGYYLPAVTGVITRNSGSIRPPMTGFFKRSVVYCSAMVSLRKQAKETMETVQETSRSIGDAVEATPLLLLGIAAVALLALGVAFIALEVATRD